MTKPRQRESLFSSEEEKQAEIECYRQKIAELWEEYTSLKLRVDENIAQREELGRRIKGMLNLKLEL